MCGEPAYLLILPGDSWLPLIAAAGTAGFFLLLTIKMNVTAWACGIAAIVGDRGLAVAVGPHAADQARRACPIRLVLPVGAQGTASHSWWATIIMLVVDATIFASFVFAYIHISMRLEVCPPPVGRLPALRWPLLSSGLLVAGSGLMLWARRSVGKGRLPWLALMATGCVIAAFVADLYGYGLAGLAPTVAGLERDDRRAAKLPGPARGRAGPGRPLPRRARMVRAPVAGAAVRRSTIRR